MHGDFECERITQAVIRGQKHLPPASTLIPKLLLARTTLADRDSIGKITQFDLQQCWWDGFEVKIDGEITDWPATLRTWPRAPFITKTRFARREPTGALAFDEDLENAFEVTDEASKRIASCGYSKAKGSWICQVLSPEEGNLLMVQQFAIGDAGPELAYLYTAKVLEDYRPIQAYF